MARTDGTKRPRGGRKRGPTRAPSAAAEETLPNRGDDLQPLDVMLQIMRAAMEPDGDGKPADAAKALQAAKSAAPYVHPKRGAAKETDGEKAHEDALDELDE